MLNEPRRDDHLLTLVFVATLGLLAALMRAAPYYFSVSAEQAFFWNLMPIGALALFCGSRLRSRLGWVVPIAVMFVSDLLLVYPLAKMGYSSFSFLGTPLIYASFTAYVALGRLVRADERSPFVIGGSALLGGVQFFLVTNLLVWLNGFRHPETAYYPLTLEGLGLCYAAAIPFYRNTLASDLLYSTLFFAGHAGLLLLAQRGLRPAPTPVGERWSPPSDRVTTRRNEVHR